MKTVHVLASSAALAALLTAMQGRLTRVTGASTACPDWPLCLGQVIPPMSRLVFLEWMHRFLVLVTALLVVMVVVAAWRGGGTARRLSLLSLGFLVATAVIGGISILTPIHPLLAAADQGLAMLTFGGLVALAVWARWAEQGSGSSTAGARQAATRAVAPHGV